MFWHETTAYFENGGSSRENSACWSARVDSEGRRHCCRIEVVHWIQMSDRSNEISWSSRPMAKQTLAARFLTSCNGFPLARNMCMSCPWRRRKIVPEPTREGRRSRTDFLPWSIWNEMNKSLSRPWSIRATLDLFSFADVHYVIRSCLPNRSNTWGIINRKMKREREKKINAMDWSTAGEWILLPLCHQREEKKRVCR